MEYEKIVYSVEDHIALIRFNSPETRNALSDELVDELQTALKDVAQNEEARVLVITGTGNAFMAGADLKQSYEKNVEENMAYSQKLDVTFAMVENLEIPVIAAMNGHAMGGGLEIALACSIRVAAETAKLGLPEVGIGLIPSAGGTYRLPKLINKGIAIELLVTGQIISARQAQEYGILNHVVAPEEVLGKSLEIAKTICSKAPIAVRAVKRFINEGLDMPRAEALHHIQVRAEAVVKSSDMKEGMLAFIEKRQPVFTGK